MAAAGPTPAPEEQDFIQAYEDVRERYKGSAKFSVTMWSYITVCQRVWCHVPQGRCLVSLCIPTLLAGAGRFGITI
ncbi:hypothetical protein WISP_107919 [Willisornis vidua]|uniref:Uncharacterized protein n=1 Tax=Willisornis vidua TaxID=1566151 RepID=A0ABQ9D2C5_9PASS|nr:hypothetical protein WISP_107919 [Willisornis vidua]